MKFTEVVGETPGSVEGECSHDLLKAALDACAKRHHVVILRKRVNYIEIIKDC